jgi:outer membrane protein TolC
MLHLSLTRLLFAPQRQALERQRLARGQGEVLAQVLAHAADVRRAWVAAVTSAQLSTYAEQVMKAAEASAELARRMAQVGNFNALARAREQSFYAEAALGLARARQAQGAARERLTRLLGLWGEQLAFTLPERLPELPGAARELPDIEQAAIAKRLDLQAARRQADELAMQLGSTRASRFAGGLELGLKRESGADGERRRGWELGFELPLFDDGEARIAHDDARWRQAVHRVHQLAVDARSEVREAYAAYRHAHDIARHHRDEIVPLRARIAEENLLRYNGMLIGVFELLADARAQTASVAAAIEAERDFWLAQVDLDAALLGKPALPGASSPTMAAPSAGGDPH